MNGKIERTTSGELLLVVCDANDRSGHPFWYTVPLFRRALLDTGSHVPRPENLVWSSSAIMLMQAAYWIRHRLRPRLPQVRNALVGHLFYLVPGCPSYWLLLFLVSSSLREDPNSSYPRLATSFSLSACSPCSVSRKNSSNWEEH